MTILINNSQSCRHFSHCHLCLKATVALQCQLHNLEAMKMEMDITDNQLESWIIDINEWAEGRIYCLILFDMLLDASLLTKLGLNSKVVIVIVV